MKTELIRMEVDADRIYLFFCNEKGGYEPYGDVLILARGIRSLVDLDSSYGVETKLNKRIK